MAKNKKTNSAKAKTEAKTEPVVETKAAGRGRAVMITHPETGEEVRRHDYIREQVLDKGRSRGEVARELGVIYQVVYASTKELKIRSAKTEGETATDASEPSGDEAADLAKA